MGTLVLDIRYACRRLARSPGYAGAIVLTLALGIGANTAIFSVFDQFVLRPLPVPQPEQLVNLGAPGPKPGSPSCDPAGDCEQVFSYSMFRDLERVQDAFAGIAAHRSYYDASVAYVGAAQDRPAETATVMFVSGSYFPVLGLNPALGRLLGAGDDPAVDEAPVAVLSYAYWQSRFGGDPGILNETLVVNGEPLTIVGVAPQGFTGTTFGRSSQVFAPITLYPQREADFADRRDYWVYLFARLEPAVSLAEARSRINATYQAIINDIEAPLQQGMTTQAMQRFLAKTITVERGQRGQSLMLSEARVPSTVLMLITVAVLLIACANVAGLLLARAATRTGELSLLLAVGAERRHLIGQCLTECALLALIAVVVAWPVAMGTLYVIGSLIPADFVAMMNLQLDLDLRAAAYAGGVTLVSVLLFGVYPALRGTRTEVATALKSHSARMGGRRAAVRGRTAMVVTQIAMSMALLVVAGLLAKSLLNATRVDLGLRADGLVTFGLSPRLNGYSPERSMRLFSRVEADLTALPGVTGVTSSTVPLLANSFWDERVTVEGFEAAPDGDTDVNYNQIGAGFFGVTGIPLIAGREFTANDASGAAKVAIVNEAFAERFGLGHAAVGKRMAVGGAQGDLDIEIVGLVGDSQYGAVKNAIPPQFFTPYRQNGGLGSLTFYVRSALPPEQLAPAIRDAVARLDATLPVRELTTLPQRIEDDLFVDYLVSVLSAAFAALATLLAAIGLYGILAYTVVCRTSELGLRAALGAAPGQLRTMVMKQVSRMSLFGGIIGFLAALALGRAAESLLFEVEAHDVSVLLGALVALGIVALGAGYLPARRAARIAPMDALRHE